jgi:multicomponent Na+:H+ antiporter subunit E
VIGRSVLLTAMWVALQGELTVGNVLGGVAVVCVLELGFPTRPARRLRVRPLAALSLAVFVARSLIVSSWQVVCAVLRPTPARVHTDIVTVTLAGTSRLVASLTANAITLTPGTLTVDIGVDPWVLHVHVLGDVSADELRASVLDLERRVQAAVTEVHR